MSSTDLIKEQLKASLPPGIFWTPKLDFDELLTAIAEQLAPYYDRAVDVMETRCPETSQRILDLADESGVDIFSTLTPEQIIMLVKLADNGVKEPGAGDLQKALNDAGFGVQVHVNSPVPRDPGALIGDDIPFMVADNENAVADNEEAIAGTFAGAAVLVNGLVLATLPVVESAADDEDMTADSEKAVADYFEESEQFSFDAMLPEDADRWNQIYFIGGDAVRTLDGEIQTIDDFDIPIERKNEFENLILKYGPADGWAGLFINYV